MINFFWEGVFIQTKGFLEKVFRFNNFHASFLKCKAFSFLLVWGCYFWFQCMCCFIWFLFVRYPNPQFSQCNFYWIFMDRDSVSEHTSVKNGSTLLSFFFLGFIFMLYALSLYGSYEFLIIRECQVLMVVRYSSRVQFQC